MKMRRMLMMFFMMVCLVSAGVLSSSDPVHAKKITSIEQAKKKAGKKVKNAVVTEVDKDYEKGKLVYEVHLIKGTKEYELIYRASDGKLIAYEWEEKVINPYSKKAVMSKKRCKKLAYKQVSKGKITKLTKKFEDGIYVYKVKMKKGNKKYTLEYHARTGELLEYGWEQVTASSKNTKNKNNYIGAQKAKEIALKEVPDAVVVKVEFEVDDGVPVYEVELLTDEFEYEIKIHAKTGKILEIDKDYIGDNGTTNKDNYIGVEKAKEIALKEVPDAVVVKIEFEVDDGVPVYEVKLVKDEFEYEIKIHARTGEIFEIDKDFMD